MNNIAVGQAGTVAGGNSNTASGLFGAMVAGGWQNVSSGSSTSLLGGANRTLGGSGTDNEAQPGPSIFTP